VPVRLKLRKGLREPGPEPRERGGAVEVHEEARRLDGQRLVVAAWGLRKCFGPREVFCDVNLTVRPGEVLTIIGRSGVGKSTLLRCLNLLELPTSGEIQLGDVRIFKDRPLLPKRELMAARRRLSMVFQQFNLVKHLTAVENVALPRVVALKEPAERAIEEAIELLDRVNLRSRALAFPRELSGGEQQRVGIARAMALHPQAILFDEPTSSLDPELRGEVLGVMRQLSEAGMTMIIVTHELRFADEVANWVVFMDQGRVVEEGPPAQVLHAPLEERTSQFVRSH
jgi:ABC-type polar amino acid transport system ATPase subunit